MSSGRPGARSSGRPRPRRRRAEHGAERNQQAVDPAIRHRDAAAEDVFEELLAVVRPADERRVAEQERAERDDPAADGRDRQVERRRTAAVLVTNVAARLPRDAIDDSATPLTRMSSR